MNYPTADDVITGILQEAVRIASGADEPLGDDEYPSDLADKICRRCDFARSRHINIPGVGSVCPVQLMTFDE